MTLKCVCVRVLLGCCWAIDQLMRCRVWFGLLIIYKKHPYQHTRLNILFVSVCTLLWEKCQFFPAARGSWDLINDGRCSFAPEVVNAALFSRACCLLLLLVDNDVVDVVLIINRMMKQMNWSITRAYINIKWNKRYFVSMSTSNFITCMHVVCALNDDDSGRTFRRSILLNGIEQKQQQKRNAKLPSAAPPNARDVKLAHMC